MIMKYRYVFIVISLSMFVLACKDGWIKVELNKEIEDYNSLISILFDGIEAKHKEKTIFYVRGDEETVERFLEIVRKLPYVKSIDNKMINVKGAPSNKNQKRIFIRYREDTSEDIQTSVETFFALKNKKHLENINGFSYIAPSSIEIKTLIMYLKSSSYIIHVEEDRKVKMY